MATYNKRFHASNLKSSSSIEQPLLYSQLPSRVQLHDVLCTLFLRLSSLAHCPVSVIKRPSATLGFPVMSAEGFLEVADFVIQNS